MLPCGQDLLPNEPLRNLSIKVPTKSLGSNVKERSNFSSSNDFSNRAHTKEKLQNYRTISVVLLCWGRIINGKHLLWIMFLAVLYGRNLQSPGWSKVPRLLDKSGLYDLGMCFELKVEPHTSMSRVCSARMHDINFYASLLGYLKQKKRGHVQATYFRGSASYLLKVGRCRLFS